MTFGPRPGRLRTQSWSWCSCTACFGTESIPPENIQLLTVETSQMWADPRTCLTHRASGMPTGRRVAAYCYAPPCLVSASLSKLAASSNLITSFVYSHDVVSRLSLGSVRDLRRATAWLSEAESEGRGEGYGGVTGRALKAKTGFGKGDDPQWVSCLHTCIMLIFSS